MSGSLIPNGKQQYFDANGTPLAGGKVYYYIPYTTTPKNTWQDINLSILNTNPIILDAAGECIAWGAGAYRQQVYDVNNNLIWDQYTYGINPAGSNFVSQEEVQTATQGQTIFTLTTITYTPGINSLVVFVNGSKQLVNVNYTETSSSVVTFASGLNAGDVVDFYASLPASAQNMSNAVTVAYDPPFTNSVATNVQAKLAQTVSVKDFGAVGDGTTDDTAAIQAAITYIYAHPANLYFPSGTYILSSVITMGNTGSNWQISPYFFGDGQSTIIKVNAANTGAFYWLGPHPDVDGAGNRATGPIIENMTFTGPGASSNTNSIALSFYGVQGITLRNTTCTGWYAGESYQNCDIVNRYNASCRYNYHGIISSATGYALTGEGQLNSFNSFNGLITNNTNFGVIYIGGQAPCFYGVNFVLNNISLIFSPNNVSGPVVTAGLIISGCYFEGDLNSSIVFGGGNGIVRDAIIEGGTIIANHAYPAILISNYQDTTGRGFINTSIELSGGATAIDQTSSVGKIAYQTLDNVAIGSVTPSTGVFTKVNSGTFIKSATASASVDILSVGSYGSVASLSLTITSTSTGKATSRKYQVLLMGNGTVTGSDISYITEVYNGGGSPFTLSETANSPVLGTNKLTITNNDSVTSNYRITYTVEDLTGTLTIL
jgi:Pectate lyase superfamily protein